MSRLASRRRSAELALFDDDNDTFRLDRTAEGVK
jgi:hypothetical protein